MLGDGRDGGRRYPLPTAGCCNARVRGPVACRGCGQGGSRTGNRAAGEASALDKASSGPHGADRWSQCAPVCSGAMRFRGRSGVPGQPLRSRHCQMPVPFRVGTGFRGRRPIRAARLATGRDRCRHARILVSQDRQRGAGSQTGGDVGKWRCGHGGTRVRDEAERRRTTRVRPCCSTSRPIRQRPARSFVRADPAVVEPSGGQGRLSTQVAAVATNLKLR